MVRHLARARRARISHRPRLLLLLLLLLLLTELASRAGLEQRVVAALRQRHAKTARELEQRDRRAHLGGRIGGGGYVERVQLQAAREDLGKPSLRPRRRQCISRRRRAGRARARAARARAAGARRVACAVLVDWRYGARAGAARRTVGRVGGGRELRVTWLGVGLGLR